jgi:hypothetical protein
VVSRFKASFSAVISAERTAMADHAKARFGFRPSSSRMPAILA